MYTSEIIDEVRSRNDIVDVVESYVALKRSGSNYMGLCPFHNEKTASFSVSPAKQICHCFGCGKGGNVFSFIMEYEGLTFPESVKFLADRVGMSLPEEQYNPEEKQRSDKRAKLLEINKLAATFYYKALRSPEGEFGMAYFQKRQLTDETMKAFGLGYASQGGGLYQMLKSKGYDDEILKDSGLFTYNGDRVNDKFWNRVIFPIMDINRKVIGFGGRVMGDGEPKYLNSPETVLFDKSRNLFGMHIARGSRAQQFIICEGYMDVISMHQAGFDQTVASLGTALTPQQCKLMKRYKDQVLVTYDSDGAGVKAAKRAIGLLKEAGLTCKVINLRPYKDPDEFIKAEGAKAFQERIDQAQNAFMYLVEAASKNYHLDTGDPAETTGFEYEIARMVAALDEKLERMNYIHAICRDYPMIPEGPFTNLVNTFGEQGLLKKENASPYERRPDEIGPTSAKPKKKKETGIDKAEKMLLNLCVDHPAIFDKVKEYLTPDDFLSDLFHETAILVYDGLEKGNLKAAAVIDHFNEDGRQAEVADIFSSDLEENTDIEKAVNDFVRKILDNSLKEQITRAGASDPLKMMELIKKQKDINKLKIEL